MAFCGVCGTDLHVLHDTFRNYPPVILGHELSGTVVETGHRLAACRSGSAWRLRDDRHVRRVRALPIRRLQFRACWRGMGHGVNGGSARYVAAWPDQLSHNPDGMTLEEGALSEPFAAIVQAVLEIGRDGWRDGGRLVWTDGTALLKPLVAQGVTAIVAGTAADRERLEAARRFGAAAVVNVESDDLAGTVRDATAGRGVDIAFECAGHPASVRGCLESLRPMGRHIQVAICGRDINFEIDRIFYKQLTIAEHNTLNQ